MLKDKKKLLYFLFILFCIYWIAKIALGLLKFFLIGLAIFHIVKFFKDKKVKKEENLSAIEKLQKRGF